MTPGCLPPNCGSACPRACVVEEKSLESSFVGWICCKQRLHDSAKGLTREQDVERDSDRSRGLRTERRPDSYRDAVYSNGAYADVGISAIASPSMRYYVGTDRTSI